MKRRTFYVYSDPGHSWVKVPKPFLEVHLGKHWRKVFTSYSYERGDFVYLEEDQDAFTFNKCMRDAGIEPIYKEGSICSSKYSRIRSYSPLAPM